LQGLDTAELRIADLYKGKVIELDAPLALSAAKISTEMKLPMADGILLATARSHNASLWTQDEHFSGIEGVRFIRRK
jgi:predicted nucleic acid-binding protein